ncbi:MAG: signal peptidase II [Desulfatibacillaceae bacterium]|nr:signal peptidase II [Desulfatibacillaceae bacterium]
MNDSSKRPAWKLFAVTAILVAVLDQATKIAAVKSITPGQSINIIPGFFDLVMVHNYGVAFGMFNRESTGIQTIVFLGLSALALGLVIFLFAKTPGKNRLFSIALSLVAGGAAGNIIDRARLGFVVDFVDLFVGKWHWPAFNVADSAISVGVALLLVIIVTGKDPF